MRKIKRCVYTNIMEGYHRKTFLLDEVMQLTSATRRVLDSCIVKGVSLEDFSGYKVLEAGNIWYYPEQLYRTEGTNPESDSYMPKESAKRIFVEKEMVIDRSGVPVPLASGMENDKYVVVFAQGVSAILITGDYGVVAHAEFSACPYIYLISETDLQTHNGIANYMREKFHKEVERRLTGSKKNLHGN